MAEESGSEGESVAAAVEPKPQRYGPSRDFLLGGVSFTLARCTKGCAYLCCNCDLTAKPPARALLDEKPALKKRRRGGRGRRNGRGNGSLQKKTKLAQEVKKSPTQPKAAAPAGLTKRERRRLRRAHLQPGALMQTGALVMLLIASLLVPVTTASGAADVPAGVWPIPRETEGDCSKPGPSLAPDLQIKLSEPSAVGDAAIKRYLPLLTKHARTTATASAAAGGESSSDSDLLHTITVQLNSTDETLGSSTDYSYTIALTSATTATPGLALTAASPYGVAYALETLSQYLAPTTAQLRCAAPLSVRDKPDYPHRGIMIDTGRRFYPVPLVESILDGMASVKMNVLHFHLSEECFRVESKAFPKLTSGCVVNGHNNTAWYTQEEVKVLVAYAKDRGIRVVPEFDMPGHSGGFCSRLSAAVTPPSAGGGIKCCGSQIEDDPEGQSAKIIGEVLTEMAGLFPDEVMNIGCDETGSSAPCTLANTKSFEVKMIELITNKLKKTPMGWEEILFKTEAAQAFPHVIVDSWARESWAQAAALGHPTVMSNVGYFYLDYPSHSARNMWFDMRKGNTNESQRQLLLGGEVSMWQDQYVGSCLFGNEQDANFSQSTSQCIWPRTAIAAGSFWGYYDTTIGDKTDPASVARFNTTFAAVQTRLGERGVSSCPCASLDHTDCSQMGSCAGARYCPAPPPPPPPAPIIGCANYSGVSGYACVETATGMEALAIGAETTVQCAHTYTHSHTHTRSESKAFSLSSCSTAAAALCAKQSASASSSASSECALFSIAISAADITANRARVRLFKKGAAPVPAPSPSAGNGVTFAVPCDPDDTNQRFEYDPSTKLLSHTTSTSDRTGTGTSISSTSGAGGTQLCVTVPTDCHGVQQLALTPCTTTATTTSTNATSTATAHAQAPQSQQQWVHTSGGFFKSVHCAGQCIDLYSGGKSNDAGLYSCTNTWNQQWRLTFTSGSTGGTDSSTGGGSIDTGAASAANTGTTFEEVRDGKCMSAAAAAPTRASLQTKAGYIAYVAQ